MKELSYPLPVKLVTGIIYNEHLERSKLENLLSEEIGSVDLTSAEFDFDCTDYYEKEMGKDLKRKIFSFRELINREDIVEIKHTTRRIEKIFCTDQGRRTVNIDPGYLAAEHLILVSGKGYYHRPYLGKGVYADLTLVYQDNRFRMLEWTYPDYMYSYMEEIFLKIRRIYMNQIRTERSYE